jgi:hypothetical protein
MVRVLRQAMIGDKLGMPWNNAYPLDKGESARGLAMSWQVVEGVAREVTPAGRGPRK